LTLFPGQRYIALETFRRNGEGVRTTVWFVEEGGRLYIWTIATSGKAKRIRNNPRVRICSSSASGRLKGNWVEAKARFVEPETYAPITDLLRRKYEVQFWLLSHLHGRGRVVIGIEPIQ